MIDPLDMTPDDRRAELATLQRKLASSRDKPGLSDRAAAIQRRIDSIESAEAEG